MTQLPLHCRHIAGSLHNEHPPYRVWPNGEFYLIPNRIYYHRRQSSVAMGIGKWREEQGMGLRPAHPSFNKGVNEGSISVRSKTLPLWCGYTTFAMTIPGATTNEQELISSIEDPVAILFGQGPFDFKLIVNRDHSDFLHRLLQRKRAVLVDPLGESF